MSSNLFAAFRRLVPGAPWLIGTVVGAESAGTYAVQLPGGSVIQARGVAAVGDSVFVRGALIEGPAPALTVVTIEV